MNMVIYLSQGIYESLTNNVLMITFVILVISFVRKKIFPGKMQILLMVISFFYMYGTVTQGKNEFGNIIPIMILFMIITYTEKTSYSKKFFQILSIVGIVVLFVNLFHTLYDSSFVNANSGAIISLMIFFYININSEINGYAYRNFIAIFFAGICLLTCILADNLTITICLFFWIFITYVIPEKFWKSVKRVKIVVTAMIAFGTAYPFMYIIYFIWGRHIPQINYIFSGREYIWMNYLNRALNEKGGIFYGLGALQEASIGFGMTMHNGYLEMLLFFGVIMVVLFWLYLMISINRDVIDHLDRVHLLCLTSYIAILLLSYTEYFIQNALFVVIANSFWGLTNNPNLSKLYSASSRLDM